MSDGKLEAVAFSHVNATLEGEAAIKVEKQGIRDRLDTNGLRLIAELAALRRECGIVGKTGGPRRALNDSIEAHTSLSGHKLERLNTLMNAIDVEWANCHKADKAFEIPASVDTYLAAIAARGWDSQQGIRKALGKVTKTSPLDRFRPAFKKMSGPERAATLATLREDDEELSATVPIRPEETEEAA